MAPSPSSTPKDTAGALSGSFIRLVEHWTIIVDTLFLYSFFISFGIIFVFAIEAKGYPILKYFATQFESACALILYTSRGHLVLYGLLTFDPDHHWGLRIQPLNISFMSFQLSSFILFPHLFELHFCQGKRHSDPLESKWVQSEGKHHSDPFPDYICSS